MKNTYWDRYYGYMYRKLTSLSLVNRWFELTFWQQVMTFASISVCLIRGYDFCPYFIFSLTGYDFCLYFSFAWQQVMTFDFISVLPLFKDFLHPYYLILQHLIWVYSVCSSLSVQYLGLLQYFITIACSWLHSVCFLVCSLEDHIIIEDWKSGFQMYQQDLTFAII